MPATAVKIPNFIMTEEYSQSVVVHGGISPRLTYANAKNCGNHMDRDPIVNATPTNPKNMSHFWFRRVIFGSIRIIFGQKGVNFGSKGSYFGKKGHF